MFLVKKDKKEGYCNIDGTGVLPIEFDEVPDGYNGFISAKKDNKWGFIDKTGNMVIEPQYEEVGRFFNK